MKKLVTLLTLMFILGSTCALAGDVISAGVGVNVENKYVWRGLLKNNDPVLQPEAFVKFYGFTVSAIGNYNWTDAKGKPLKNSFDEIDFNLDHTSKWGEKKQVILVTGLTYYTYPNTDPRIKENTELYVGLGYETLLGTPMIKAYYDIDQTGGMYYEASWTKQLTIVKGFDWYGGASVGYSTGSIAKDRYLLDNNEFTNAEAKMGIKIALPLGFELVPNVSYSRLLKNDNLQQDDQYILYGLKFGWAF